MSEARTAHNEWRECCDGDARSGGGMFHAPGPGVVRVSAAD